MTGNSNFRHQNASLLAVTSIDAPVVVTSRELDERLKPSLQRLRLPRGLLDRLAGVSERRWWDASMDFDDAAIEAGAKALAEAGVEPGDVGLLINTSVTRKHLEPSVAVKIHHGLGLPSSALNFDVANACLGFVNGMSLASTMIDAGQIRYAVVVAGEDAGETQRATLERLLRPDVTREDFNNEFATLTLGSGAAAAVIGPSSDHPGAHRILGGVARAGTEHHDLCVGDINGMRTDTNGLLEGGLELVLEAWRDAQGEWDWNGMDRYFMHQVSNVHLNAIVKALDLDTARVPVTYPTLGNVGPAALPITLAQSVDTLNPGDRVLCMGVGSGLNTAMTEILW
ncbi:3-oxoacyl-ACP synthase III [Saxibacter everestensis]|uniref:3-oxoacyl-ACP synthase III n=1 Tax=Saxibacter everestensis TaxID=2909229 RepID=A0ABY8QQ39_9MICO|nr:3-oxoacyl-ACP synthase III [Brevibacteriaceae bacterium ZFBP1038]